MSFRDICLNYSYETGKDDVVNDFYVPLLAESIKYDRIAGFFSSTSLAIAARGIAGLIRNHGKMRIIACPQLSERDIGIIQEVDEFPEKYISDRLIESLTLIEDEFQRDHLYALGWMLANGFLEIKLAFVVADENAIDHSALFHQKIGILTDIDGDQVSFSGSINETASGWLKNIEEFKVFRGWVAGQDSYLDADVIRFEEFWNGDRRNVRVIDLPDAVIAHLIQISSSFSIDHFITQKYVRVQKEKSISERLQLFPYQYDAYKAWVDNKRQLLFEMATGTGKTRTAIACINDILIHETTSLVIIACPQSTLSRQWKTEIESIGLQFDNSIIADASNRHWREDLKRELKLLLTGFHRAAILYTTHVTASSSDFLDIIQTNHRGIPICFIGDETHGLGAYKTKKALLEEYIYRIGLSATPARWFDDNGSKILQEYYGSQIFRFTISDALITINPLTNKPFLVEFEYHPIFVKLSDDELEEYQGLSAHIKRMSAYSQNSEEYQKKLETLLFARSKIIKNAIMKYESLNDILNTRKVVNTIIFVSDGQIDKVIEILHKHGIVAHRFTQDEGTTPNSRYGGISERQYLIKKFRDHTYQALVAIKCLDEGIDIPTADTAIIMASSTNPREYVQRVGRVIRQAKDKRRAYIFDFVVEPDLYRIKDPELACMERSIFEKEMIRIMDMSANSINNASTLVAINDRKRRIIDGTK